MRRKEQSCCPTKRISPKEKRLAKREKKGEKGIFQKRTNAVDARGRGAR